MWDRALQPCPVSFIILAWNALDERKVPIPRVQNRWLKDCWRLTVSFSLQYSICLVLNVRKENLTCKSTRNLHTNDVVAEAVCQVCTNPRIPQVWPTGCTSKLALGWNNLFSITKDACPINSACFSYYAFSRVLVPRLSFLTRKFHSMLALTADAMLDLLIPRSLHLTQKSNTKRDNKNQTRVATSWQLTIKMLAGFPQSYSLPQIKVTLRGNYFYTVACARLPLLFKLLYKVEEKLAYLVKHSCKDSEQYIKKNLQP